MRGIKGTKRTEELLSIGCPQCKQKEEFKIIKEKYKERTFTVWFRVCKDVRVATSDDDWQNHIILCPACDWEEDI